MRRRSQTLLIFAEDPGAANYVADLPHALSSIGWQVHLMTRGAAGTYLARRGIHSTEVPPAASPVALLAELQPSLCLIGTAENPHTFGIPLIDAALYAGIPSIGVVDASMNATFRFRGQSNAPLTHAPDWLLVPDPATYDAMAAIGYPTQRMIVCGHPHYDYVLAERKRLSRMDYTGLRKRLSVRPASQQPVVLYAAECLTVVTPGILQRTEQYTLAGYSGSPGREEIVIEEFLEAVASLVAKPYLVLRLHPIAPPSEYDPYASKFDQVSRSESAMEIIHASDLVVGMSSLFLLEATILGVPTLSILPDAREQDWLPTIRMGLTPCVTTRDTLRSTLSALVQTSDPATRPTASGFVSGALERVVEFICRIANGSSRHD